MASDQTSEHAGSDKSEPLSDAAPETTPEAKGDAAPETEPEVEGDAAPEAASEATEDPKPEAAEGGGREEEPAVAPAMPAPEPSARSPLPASTLRNMVIIALTVAVILVIIALSLFFSSQQATSPIETPEEQAPSSAAEQSSSAEETAPAPLSAPSTATQAIQAQVSSVISSYTTAQGVVSVTYLRVDDPSDGFTIAGDDIHASASLIKLLILADLLQQAHDGAISLDTPLTMQASDIVGGSGEIAGTAPGTTYTVDQLANYMIAASDNTATNMLIDALGMDNINAEAQALGLTGMSLERKMMDTAAQAQGLENRISANDAATILQMIASGTLIDQATSEKALAYLTNQEIDEGLVAGIGDASVVVAHKTGELDGVVNDGGIVYAAQGPYVLVVLTEGLPNGTATQLIKDVSSAVYQGVCSAASLPAITDETGVDGLPAIQ